ncbi:uncharacterized protein NPIL_554641 [Nephila pilipes]|uniref:Gustatory receptor n=1 Tax=Nephila pilipes TaxID=299642 RepID=A0A8X6UGS2_NEPPI|nr:uncharacterized protein NPIL_554641 [Nephila pilipes]
MTFFRWTGFIEELNQKVRHIFASRVFDILLIVTCVDLSISKIAHSDSTDLKSVIAFIFCYISSAMAWYAMRYKRKDINSLLKSLRGINSTSHDKIINFLVFIDCCLPVIFAAIFTYATTETEFLSSYSYGLDLKHYWVVRILISIKIYFYYALYPSTTNIVALFYASLCWCCSVHISILTKEINQHITDLFELSQQIDILKRKKNNYDVLNNIQNVFSVPILFIVLANVFMCSAITGRLLVKNDSKIPISIRLGFMYYLVNAILCIVITLWIAGSVPIEMNKFKETFYKKAQERLLLRIANTEELQLKIDLINEPDFELTGFDILPIRRSTIFALIGTLFTYTVLVISTNAT